MNGSKLKTDAEIVPAVDDESGIRETIGIG